jgi:heme/copper-type cytochrome/quinol oxidase subunit 2
MIRTTVEAVTLTIAGITSSGTSAIGLATMQITQQNSENINTSISMDTWMPLGLFLAGIAMTATVVWKVSAHKTKTDNKIEIIEEKIKQLENKKKLK